MLAVNLKQLREQKGLSQNQLAKLANVPQSAIHYIENGERNPGLQTVEKLADGLGVTLSKLVESKESQ
ncbi:transcriptional regulator, XRE family [Desulforamulus reducens MI-1]|uniref:Transcriptional regulator, XRE family n=1 Tax=Desulforamulus reducens (strain ATCC BAA-1160 / DSM 100696 / MI-1) TaxID=349161 RepID=A4J2X1_DESRM|nr:helix-turn-helix transcriptional regulator [Desulforamulus reducens]ABO49424.1 transcriptional regulator, XRE family [Desulforamulus reducens MI-1]